MEAIRNHLGFEEAVRIYDQTEAVRRVNESNLFQVTRRTRCYLFSFKTSIDCMYMPFIRQGNLIGRSRYLHKVQA